MCREEVVTWGWDKQIYLNKSEVMKLSENLSISTWTSLDLSCTWKVSLGVGVVEGGGDGLLLVSPASHKERPVPEEDDDLEEEKEKSLLEVKYEVNVKNKEADQNSLFFLRFCSFVANRACLTVF